MPGASWIKEMTAIGSRVFFVAGKAGEAAGDLWVSNGTSRVPSGSSDIDPTRADRVSNLAAVGGTLFFRAHVTPPTVTNCGRATAPSSAR